MNEIQWPHSIDLEQSIISGILNNPETADTVFKTLSPADFWDKGCKAAAQSIQDLYLKGQPCDLPSVVFALREAGQGDHVSASFLSGLMDAAPVPSSVEHYCSKLADLSNRRKAIILGNKITQHAQNPAAVDEDIFQFAQRMLAVSMNGHAGKQTDRKCFSLIPINKMELTIPKFIVNETIETDTLYVKFGDPEACKSLIAADMLACVATGTPFHGLPVKQGPVVYIVGEGQGGIRRRFKAWEIKNQVSLEDAPLYVSTAPMGLCDDIELVLRNISAVADEAGPPVLIIIDTLARNFGSGDENSTSDMTRAVSAADRIRNLYQSAVGLIHHSGVADKSRGRGNSALKGAVDAEYKMSKDMDDVIRFEAKKMKDAPYPDPMAFKLAVVELGVTDDDGNEVSSVALRRIDYEPPVNTNSNSGLGKNQRAAMDILKSIFEKHRANREASNLDPESAMVTISDWRGACKESGIRYRARWRNEKALQDKGLVTIKDGFVYLK